MIDGKTETPAASPTRTMTAVPTETNTIIPPEKTGGFEGFLAIIIFMAIYTTRRNIW